MNLERTEQEITVVAERACLRMESTLLWLMLLDLNILVVYKRAYAGAGMIYVGRVDRLTDQQLEDVIRDRIRDNFCETTLSE